MSFNGQSWPSQSFYLPPSQGNYNAAQPSYYLPSQLGGTGSAIDSLNNLNSRLINPAHNNVELQIPGQAAYNVQLPGQIAGTFSFPGPAPINNLHLPGSSNTQPQDPPLNSYQYSGMSGNNFQLHGLSSGGLQDLRLLSGDTGQLGLPNNSLRVQGLPSGNTLQLRSPGSSLHAQGLQAGNILQHGTLNSSLQVQGLPSGNMLQFRSPGSSLQVPGIMSGNTLQIGPPSNNFQASRYPSGNSLQLGSPGKSAPLQSSYTLPQPDDKTVHYTGQNVDRAHSGYISNRVQMPNASQTVFSNTPHFGARIPVVAVAPFQTQTSARSVNQQPSIPSLAKEKITPPSPRKKDQSHVQPIQSFIKPPVTTVSINPLISVKKEFLSECASQAASKQLSTVLPVSSQEQRYKPPVTTCAINPLISIKKEFLSEVSSSCKTTSRGPTHTSIPAGQSVPAKQTPLSTTTVSINPILNIKQEYIESRQASTVPSFPVSTFSSPTSSLPLPKSSSQASLLTKTGLTTATASAMSTLPINPLINIKKEAMSVPQTSVAGYSASSTAYSTKLSPATTATMTASISSSVATPTTSSFINPLIAIKKEVMSDDQYSKALNTPPTTTSANSITANTHLPLDITKAVSSRANVVINPLINVKKEFLSEKSCRSEQIPQTVFSTVSVNPRTSVATDPNSLVTNKTQVPQSISKTVPSSYKTQELPDVTKSSGADIVINPLINVKKEFLAEKSQTAVTAPQISASSVIVGQTTAADYSVKGSTAQKQVSQGNVKSLSADIVFNPLINVKKEYLAEKSKVFQTVAAPVTLCQTSAAINSGSGNSLGLNPQQSLYSSTVLVQPNFVPRLNLVASSMAGSRPPNQMIPGLPPPPLLVSGIQGPGGRGRAAAQPSSNRYRPMASNRTQGQGRFAPPRGSQGRPRSTVPTTEPSRTVNEKKTPLFQLLEMLENGLDMLYKYMCSLVPSTCEFLRVEHFCTMSQKYKVKGVHMGISNAFYESLFCPYITNYEVKQFKDKVMQALRDKGYVVSDIQDNPAKKGAIALDNLAWQTEKITSLDPKVLQQYCEQTMKSKAKPEEMSEAEMIKKAFTLKQVSNSVEPKKSVEAKPYDPKGGFSELSRIPAHSRISGTNAGIVPSQRQYALSAGKTGERMSQIPSVVSGSVTAGLLGSQRPFGMTVASAGANLRVDSMPRHLPLNPLALEGCKQAKTGQSGASKQRRHSLHGTTIDLTIQGEQERDQKPILLKGSMSGMIGVKCYLCAFIATSVENVWNHVIVTHVGLEKAKGTKHKFFCTHCTNGFSSYKDVEAHEKNSHISESPCFFCGLAIHSSKDHLDTTYWQHIIQKHSQLHVCPVCKGNFMSVDAFHEHCKATGHKPSQKSDSCYQCPYCNLRYLQQTALMKHIDGCYSEKIPVGKFCQSCKKKFLDQDALDFHNSCESGNPRKAPKCNPNSLANLAQFIISARQKSAETVPKHTKTRTLCNVEPSADLANIPHSEEEKEKAKAAEGKRSVSVNGKSYSYEFEEFARFCEIHDCPDVYKDPKILDVLVHLAIQEYLRLQLPLPVNEKMLMKLALLGSRTSVMNTYLRKKSVTPFKLTDTVKAIMEDARTCVELTLKSLGLENGSAQHQSICANKQACDSSVSPFPSLSSSSMSLSSRTTCIPATSTLSLVQSSTYTSSGTDQSTSASPAVLPTLVDGNTVPVPASMMALHQLSSWVMGMTPTCLPGGMNFNKQLFNHISLQAGMNVTKPVVGTTNQNEPMVGSRNQKGQLEDTSTKGPVHSVRIPRKLLPKLDEIQIKKAEPKKRGRPSKDKSASHSYKSGHKKNSDKTKVASQLFVPEPSTSSVRNHLQRNTKKDKWQGVLQAYMYESDASSDFIDENSGSDGNWEPSSCSKGKSNENRNRKDKAENDENQRTETSGMLDEKMSAPSKTSELDESLPSSSKTDNNKNMSANQTRKQGEKRKASPGKTDRNPDLHFDDEEEATDVYDSDTESYEGAGSSEGDSPGIGERKKMKLSPNVTPKSGKSRGGNRKRRRCNKGRAATDRAESDITPVKRRRVSGNSNHSGCSRGVKIHSVPSRWCLNLKRKLINETLAVRSERICNRILQSYIYLHFYTDVRIKCCYVKLEKLDEKLVSELSGSAKKKAVIPGKCEMDKASVENNVKQELFKADDSANVEDQGNKPANQEKPPSVSEIKEMSPAIAKPSSSTQQKEVDKVTNSSSLLPTHLLVPVSSISNFNENTCSQQIINTANGKFIVVPILQRDSLPTCSPQISSTMSVPFKHDKTVPVSGIPSLSLSTDTTLTSSSRSILTFTPTVVIPNEGQVTLNNSVTCETSYGSSLPTHLLVPVSQMSASVEDNQIINLPTGRFAVVPIYRQNPECQMGNNVANAGMQIVQGTDFVGSVAPSYTCTQSGSNETGSANQGMIVDTCYNQGISTALLQPTAVFQPVLGQSSNIDHVSNIVPPDVNTSVCMLSNSVTIPEQNPSSEGKPLQSAATNIKQESVCDVETSNSSSGVVISSVPVVLRQTPFIQHSVVLQQPVGVQQNVGVQKPQYVQQPVGVQGSMGVQSVAALPVQQSNPQPYQPSVVQQTPVPQPPPLLKPQIIQYSPVHSPVQTEDPLQRAVLPQLPALQLCQPLTTETPELSACHTPPVSNDTVPDPKLGEKMRNFVKSLRNIAPKKKN